MTMISREMLIFDQRFRPGLDIFVNHASEGFKLPQHTHDAVELCYVTEGSGFHYINDTVQPVGRGDLFLIPVGTSHVFRPSSPKQVRDLHVINCVFRMEAVQPCQSYLTPGSPLEQVLFHSDALGQPWLHGHDKEFSFYDLFQSILTEYRQASHGYPFVVQALFHQILALLNRYTQTECTALGANPAIENALRYIKRTYHQDITLRDVADHSHISSSHLHKLLKQVTGSTFTYYLQNLRVKKSCELLTTSSMTVQSIAEAVGYRDMKFFHRLFRERMGTTPNEYRKQGRGMYDIASSEEAVELTIG
jgi:AraC family transcriptional regulator, L-rhamnose operon transcriptional activator RhaR